MFLIVVIVLVILVGSFLCSLTEAALYSIPRARIETLRRQGARRGEILAQLRDHVDEPIAAILTLNTILNAAGSALAGALVAQHYGSRALGIFSAVLTISILIFSEIIPKSLGFRFASRIAPALAWPLKIAVFTLYPLIKLCVMVTTMFGRARLAAPTEEDIISMALMSKESGSVREQEARWIANALHLDKVVAKDLMTPLTVVRRVAADMPLRMTKTDADHWRFSRIPVYAAGDPDKIIGVVQRRHVFQHLIDKKEELLISDVMLPPIFVNDRLPAHELLSLFIKSRKHLFCVSDASGKWVGIVTLEDVLEALIGTEIVGEQDLFVDMQEAARQAERAQVLTADLKRGGGIIEHVVVNGRSDLVGKTIKESGLPGQALVGPIVREGTVIVPRGDLTLLEGDKITLIGARSDVVTAKKKLDPSAADTAKEHPKE
jgi:CBS domain containing-hemolysin-like protein